MAVLKRIAELERALGELAVESASLEARRRGVTAELVYLGRLARAEGAGPDVA